MKIVSRKEAKEQGLTRYFTGKPCKHGHVALRETINATCVDCIKATREKFKDKIQATSREWRKQNADHIKAFRKQYYKDNKEREAVKNKQWRRENPKKHAEINRAWAAANPSSVRATKQRRIEKDPESFYELARQRYRRFYENNPGYGRAETAKRRAAKLQRTPAWADKEAIKFFYECCPADCHVDHVIPLQGEFISGLHVETNLQWLPIVDNIRKGNKYDVGDEFVWLEKI